MKLLYTLFLALALSFSAFSAEVKPVWLIKYISVTTESGIKGYAAGTMLLREGDKFRAGQDIISVPAGFYTDNLQWAVAIAKGDYAQQQAIQLEIAKNDAAAAKLENDKIAARQVDSGPKVVHTVPQMKSNLGTSSLQMSKGIGASGSTSGSHSRTSRGFYVNEDGSLGKRVGEK